METGYIDLQARFYDPLIGRFMQVDPETEGQLEFSPYHYSFNNPIRFSDPDGRFPIVLPLLPYIAGAVAEAGVIGATVATAVYGGAVLLKKGIEAGLSGDAYSPATGAAMSLSTPGEITGGYRNANGSKGDVGTPNSKNNSNSDAGKYSHLKEPNTVGDGRKTTPAQRQRILEENKKQSGGNLKSDGDGRPLNPPKQSKKGEKADMNQAEVDHKTPRSLGGSNSNSNLRVISKEENLKKGNREQ